MNITLKRSICTVLMALCAFIFIGGTSVASANSHQASTFLGSIVPESCDGVDDNGVKDEGVCGFCDLLTLADRIIEFLIFIALIIAVLVIIFGGFLYLTAGGNTGQISKGHGTMRAAIIGLLFTLASWLIVELVMSSFLNITLFSPWTLPGC